MPKITIPEVEHSLTGASGADRWMNCPGSVNLIRKLGKKARQAGADAALGTASHTIASICLNEQQEPWEYAGYELDVAGQYAFVVDDEMIASVQTYVDFVWGMVDKYADRDPILQIEQPLHSEQHKDAWGTADCVIEIPGERLIIADFKNGMLPVEPNSAQNKMYAAMRLEQCEEDPDRIFSYIAQPRMAHPLGPVRSLPLKPAEVRTWFAEEVIPAIEATKKQDAHLTIGPWCRFCAARNHCPALPDANMYYSTEVAPVYLTDEELDEQLHKYDAIMLYGEKYLKEEAFRRIKSGAKLETRKLVEKKATRVWKSKRTVNKKDQTLAAAATEKFGEEAYTDPVLKTPAQIEKLKGGKAFTAGWAFSPKTGYTIAPRSDPRQEVRTLMDQAGDDDPGF